MSDTNEPESPLETLLVIVVRVALFVGFGIPGLIGAGKGLALMIAGIFGDPNTVFPGYLLFCLSMPFAALGCGVPLVGGAAP